MSNTFQHAGHVISLDHTGKFTTKIGAQWVKKTSLPAIKKAIDEALKAKFKPFSALVSPEHREKPTKGLPKGVDLVRVQVVGIQKSALRWYKGKFEFVVQRPGMEGVSSLTPRADVHPDTPEFLAAYVAARKYEAETEVIEQQRKREQDKLDALVTHIDPNEYAKGSAS